MYQRPAIIIKGVNSWKLWNGKDKQDGQLSKMRRCHAIPAIIDIEVDHQGAKNAKQWIVLNVRFGLLPAQEPYCIADSVVLNDHDRSTIGKYMNLRS